MATIDKLINAFSRVNPVDVIFDTLKKDEKTITDFNKEQLLQGERNDGTNTPQYSGSPMSEIYVDEKIDKGRISESTLPYMNFFNEGDFFRGFQAKIQARSLSVFSTDSKSSELQDEHGTNILGLQRKNVDKLVTLKKPTIQLNYKQKLRL